MRLMRISLRTGGKWFRCSMSYVSKSSAACFLAVVAGLMAENFAEAPLSALHGHPADAREASSRAGYLQQSRVAAGSFGSGSPRSYSTEWVGANYWSSGPDATPHPYVRIR